MTSSPEAQMQSPTPTHPRAFTLIELVVVIACLVVLALLFLPNLTSGPSTKKLGCESNLKQIGLSFSTWGLDNNDRFPMEVSATNGGTLELVAGGSVFPHFQVMSNELSSPKLLLCPEDKKRTYATNFTCLTDKNLSYFVNVDSTNANRALLLTGDGNLTNRASPGSPFIKISKAVTLAWTRERHEEKGNVGFGDGSVRAFSNQNVAATIRMPDGVTNRLAVP
jgi:prepilin-type N-terminal cleavage/methylation domain-containing protein/prepilin-type processing-associated H-X9-DG protein